MNDGREIRLGRLFGDAGKAVVVACDHGMFDGPHTGMEDIPAMLERVGDGAGRLPSAATKRQPRRSAPGGQDRVQA